MGDGRPRRAVSGAGGASEEQARREHYGDFYGLHDGGLGRVDAIALVSGNCQAESLRVMLDGGGLQTVRIPPVHELTADDLPYLDQWLGRARLLVSQPVRDDYRGLPLGIRQLSARLGPDASTVAVPVIRFAGLYPWHAIIRPPSDTSLVPPLVAYHDLRVLAEAAGLGSPSGLTVAMVRAIADDSRAELVRREVQHDTVLISDLFDRPRFAQMRTLNHPGNVVFEALAERVRSRAGLPKHEPRFERPLLNSVHAPREAAVLEAWGLDPEDDPIAAPIADPIADPVADAAAPAGATSGQWIVDGRAVSVETVREAHLAWYAEHPDAVAAGLTRHRRALDHLGIRA